MAKATTDQMAEWTARIEQGVRDVFESGRYAEYLQVMSRFHRYSVNNSILILLQMPAATRVAGYNAWQDKFHRHVRRGEKSIRIIAPVKSKVTVSVPVRDPVTADRDGAAVVEEREVERLRFRPVPVFDLSQTEGDPLPELARELTGNVEQYRDFFAALERVSPVPIGFEKIRGDAHGYYHLEEKRIAIAEGMSELQTLKTAIHEIAHAKLHDFDLNAPKEEQRDKPDRRTREIQAESVAYTVCQHYGLDTSDYSFGYLAGWSSGRELAELKSSLETIRSAAAEIINGIDAQLAEVTKDREQVVAQEELENSNKENLAMRRVDESPAPDPLIDPDILSQHGYNMGELLPLSKDRAMELFTEYGAPVSLVFADHRLLMAFSIEEIETHDELFAIQRDDWAEISAEVPERDLRQRLQDAKGDAFVVYQLREDAPRELHFAAMSELQSPPDPANYKAIYIQLMTDLETLAHPIATVDVLTPDKTKIRDRIECGTLAMLETATMQHNGEFMNVSLYQENLPMTDFLANLNPLPNVRIAPASHVYTDWTAEQALEEIYRRFNIGCPADFTGHSLSVGDVVVLRHNGELSAHFCDRFGWKELPGFLPERENPQKAQTAEKQTVEEQTAEEHTPYTHSAQYAMDHNELELYQASLRGNRACRKAIETSIEQHYQDNSLNAAAAVKEVMDQFGPERTLYVLANTVQHKSWDGRISQSNKQWADSVTITTDDSPDNAKHTKIFVVESHPGLTDIFIREARKEAELRQAEHHRENPLKNAEMSLEDDYGMIDGIINNGPKDPPKPTQERPSVLEKLREKKAKVRANEKPPDDRSLKDPKKNRESDKARYEIK